MFLNSMLNVDILCIMAHPCCQVNLLTKLSFFLNHVRHVRFIEYNFTVLQNDTAYQLYDVFQFINKNNLGANIIKLY
jgi:hypothetical protein